MYLSVLIACTSACFCSLAQTSSVPVVNRHDETQPWLHMLHSDSMAGVFEAPHLTPKVHLIENAFVNVDDATSRLDNFQEGHGPALPKYSIPHGVLLRRECFDSSVSEVEVFSQDLRNHRWPNERSQIFR